MNFVLTNGYLQKKAEYILNDKGKHEYRFFIGVYSNAEEESYAIPFKAVGETADWLYVNASIGDYMEIIGEIVRPSPQVMYVRVIKPTVKKAKSNKQYTIRTSEILELFNPSTVLERVDNKNKK